MYIAIKWLIGLTFAMWLAMCFTDLIIKQSKISIKEGIPSPPVITQYRNLSQTEYNKIPLKSKIQLTNKKQQGSEALHLVMFVAGALAVTVFNRKRDIFTFATQKIKFDVNIFVRLWKQFEYTATTLSAAIVKRFTSISENIKNEYYIFRDVFEETKALNYNKVIDNLVIKLKQLGDERKNLSQLLLAAINENKNIRMRFQLEVMAKKRLEQHIENTQKKMKEHRSRYVSFQQLYLVTHQENIFLKGRIQKLTQEKDYADSNFMRLINEIYKSTDKELKAYCSRIVAEAKDNQINTEISKVVQKFLEKSRKSLGTSWQESWSRYDGIDSSRKACSPRINDIVQDNSLVPTSSAGPKLRGLPGEYVWTVKDKNGIIEKLYEYNSESDYDNGDTIRRIRQYSVYFDKDCLLDFTKSITDSEYSPSTSSSHINNLYPVTSKRIVTGSEAFQNFLKNNKSIAPPTKTRMTLKY